MKEKNRRFSESIDLLLLSCCWPVYSTVRLNLEGGIIIQLSMGASLSDPLSFVWRKIPTVKGYFSWFAAPHRFFGHIPLILLNAPIFFIDLSPPLRPMNMYSSILILTFLYFKQISFFDWLNLPTSDHFLLIHAPFHSSRKILIDFSLTLFLVHGLKDQVLHLTYMPKLGTTCTQNEPLISLLIGHLMYRVHAILLGHVEKIIGLTDFFKLSLEPLL